MSLNLLSVQNLRKTYGSRVLLQDVSFAVADGERIGCVGRNGAGKSTLIRMIAEMERADAGEIAWMPQLRLGVLEQEEDFLADETVIEYLERKSAKADWECAKMAGVFQIKKDRLQQIAISLSSGFRMRVKLTALLLRDPNLLLLDEPTNFLDLPTVLLLEDVLKKFRGAFIVVSHDREFLKNTCEITMEVDRGRVERYNGNIESWIAYKAERQELIERHNKNIEAERRHMQEFVDRFRAKASKATQAQERLKRLAKLEKIDILQPLKTTRIVIPTCDDRKATVLRVQDCVMGYANRSVIENVHLELNRGQHIAVLGENGQGKTTFLKTIADVIPPVAGHVRWAHKLKIATYAQFVYEALDGSETAGEYLARVGDGLLQEQILRMAGNFLFSIDDLEKTCAMLSGGEKARLCLAGLLLGKPDVLLLDEPTNHLDMETVEALGHALHEWNGTVFFVSHDRTFVNLLATTILDVGEGRVMHYPGTYEEYMWDMKRRLELRVTSLEVEEMRESKEEMTTRKERYEVLKKKRQLATKLEKQFNEFVDEKRTLHEELVANAGAFSLELNQRLATLDTMIRHTETEWNKTIEDVWKMELE